MVAISGTSIALVGDQSDHGGTIITGDPTATVNGKPIARVGDLHACPQFYSGIVPHGTTPIIPAGCPTARALINGQPNALNNDITGCGAKIMSFQQDAKSNC